jgi:hypothetical protein
VQELGKKLKVKLSVFFQLCLKDMAKAQVSLAPDVVPVMALVADAD